MDKLKFWFIIITILLVLIFAGPIVWKAIYGTIRQLINLG